MTEDEMKKRKGVGGPLLDRVVCVQLTKPPKVAARTTTVLEQYGHNKEASLLRGW